jgi:hypothetical protein
MSVSIADLWLAIVLAGILCWVASALIHMLIKYHNADYKALANEEAVAKALGESSPQPALYTLPHCIDMKQMGEQSMQDKFNKGPVAMIAVLPNGMPPMVKLMGQQILFFVFGAFFTAYLSTMALMAGSDAANVFRFVSVAAFLIYGWAQIPYSIWMGQPWSNCFRFMIDAAIYAAVTGGVFAYFWPSLL